jgi:hypothetical protein|tara:strand:+ start:269 stop:970 length:702 start_codon:yes stop_codon:yes gene_type:complete
MIYFNTDWKRIGISVSGGADSALLAYLICKNVSTTIEIHILSHVRMWKTRPWQRNDSINVYNWLVERFPHITFHRHENFIPPDLEYGDKGAHIEDEYGQLRSGDQIIVRAHAEWIAHTHQLEAWYAGKTKNPSDPTITKGMPDRDIVVEDPNELVKEHKGVTVCHPFLYTEKDIVIAQYVKHNILDLLTITRSCEGDFANLDHTNYIPGQAVPECGECFWCQERNWAKEKNNV